MSESDLTNRNVEVLASADGAAKLLFLAPVNAHGVSYNRFPNFSTEEELAIMNLDDSGTAAKVIIVRAPEITLAHKIKVVGAPADLLFIADRKVTCNNCEFIESPRILLAATKTSVSATSRQVGDLTASGSVYIRNLKAPGALSVDVVANRTNINGMTTNLTAKRHPRGGYEVSDSGGVVIGSGGINLFNGNVTVNYENQKLVNASASSYPVELANTIKAAAINISSTSQIKINANAKLDTRSELLSTANYQGNFQPIIEGIRINYFGTQSAITNQGELHSDNDIELNSLGVITNVGVVSGKDVQLVAGGVLRNEGANKTLIKALDELKITAQQVTNFNSARIRGERISIAAEKSVINKWGGSIIGRYIDMHSQTSIIRNGSRYSYNPDSEESDSLTLEQLTKQDTFDIGFSHANEQFDGNRVKSSAALIFGSRITISAKRFENINPYFVWRKSKADWQEGIPLDANQARQVGVYAEKSLEIDAPEYLLNASAIMGVNEDGGVMRLHSNLIDNERYKVHSSVDIVTEGVDKKLSASLLFYSPPGFIYSFGRFESKGRTGFLNNTGFFQVFGDAHFDFPNGSVKSIGIELSDEQRTKMIKKVNPLYEKCMDKVIIESLLLDPEICGSKMIYVPDTKVKITNVKQRETLFHIAGNVMANQAKLILENYDAVEEVKTLAFKNYVEDYFNKHNGTLVEISKISENKQTGEVQIKAEYKEQICQKEKRDEVAHPVDNPITCGYVTPTKTINLSYQQAWEQLKRYVDKMNQEIQNWIDQAEQWWNS
ncbi:hypothetical protein [Pseudoalteromonas piscicida]|uniref:hypothetical protein n=1 Tax=Pseudoalteromonas piscicida TaxID=43662 RepID=UPI00155216E7|nr:hypothetical protein [Pseudoalteromonas piscicida]